MKFIRKHTTLIIIILILILCVIGLIFLKDFFLSNDAEAIYGSRLDGIEKVPITEENKKSVIDGYNKELADKTEVRVSGRIIYIDIQVKEGVDVNTLRGSGQIIVAAFTEEQKAYYDIQVLATSKTNDKDYPLLGYKHHKKTDFSWVNKKTES